MIGGTKVEPVKSEAGHTFSPVCGHVTTRIMRVTTAHRIFEICPDCAVAITKAVAFTPKRKRG